MGLFTRKSALDQLNTPIPSKHVDPKYPSTITVPRTEEPVGRGARDVNLVLYLMEAGTVRLADLRKEMKAMDVRFDQISKEMSTLQKLLEVIQEDRKPAAPHTANPSAVYPTLTALIDASDQWVE